MNARISANADAATSAFAPQSSCAEIIFLIADASTDTREEETMNKKTLRGVPKKAAAIPKSEERIRLEARREFAVELMIELRRECEKAIETQNRTWCIFGSTLPAYYGGKAFAFGDAMRMICGKVYEE